VSTSAHEHGPTAFHRHRALAVLAERWPALATDAPLELDALDALLAAVDPTLRVVRQQPKGPAYEVAVAQGEVPTRAGSWHDVFNVVAFASFPHAKRALHARMLALQHARRSAREPGTRHNDRSREEDALALLDECSLIVIGSEAGIAAYEAAEPDTLGPDTLDHLDHIVHTHALRARVLGHALHEHLVHARPPIHILRITLALPDPRWPLADLALAARITAGCFPAPPRKGRLPWPDARIDRWLDPFASSECGEV
jgi:hypothetical protein